MTFVVKLLVLLVSPILPYLLIVHETALLFFLSFWWADHHAGWFFLLWVSIDIGLMSHGFYVRNHFRSPKGWISWCLPCSCFFHFGSLRWHNGQYVLNQLSKIMALAQATAPIKGAVTCAVCLESAQLVTFLTGNVSTGVVTWSELRCGASGESGKKVAAAPLSKTAAAAAVAKTRFAKHPLDYMLHSRFHWKRSGRRSSMWPPYSLRRNVSAAACRPCHRSFKRWARGRDVGRFRRTSCVLVIVMGIEWQSRKAYKDRTITGKIELILLENRRKRE